MNIKKNVFSSESERKVYKSLDTVWGQKFNLFSALPFTNIINVQDTEFTEGERRYLRSTSVDFTLCEKDSDRPLVSVEFDGLSHGFSRSGQFVETLQTQKDPNRKWKLDLKLKAAQEVFYPFYVVSYTEAYPFNESFQLSVLDGILSHVLQGIYLPQFLSERADELDDRLENNFSTVKEVYARIGESYSREDFIQDWITEKEIEMEYEFNPFAKKASELRVALLRKGVEISAKTEEWVDDPNDSFGTKLASGVQSRLEQLRNASQTGAHVVLEGSFGKVEKTIWVRNVSLPSIFTSDFDMTPSLVAMDIARLQALHEINTNSHRV